MTDIVQAKAQLKLHPALDLPHMIHSLHKISIAAGSVLQWVTEECLKQQARMSHTLHNELLLGKQIYCRFLDIIIYKTHFAAALYNRTVLTQTAIIHTCR